VNRSDSQFNPEKTAILAVIPQFGIASRFSFKAFFTSIKPLWTLSLRPENSGFFPNTSAAVYTGLFFHSRIDVSDVQAGIGCIADHDPVAARLHRPLGYAQIRLGFLTVPDRLLQLGDGPNDAAHAVSFPKPGNFELMKIRIRPFMPTATFFLIKPFSKAIKSFSRIWLSWKSGRTS
jgi:hypothetical protein